MLDKYVEIITKVWEKFAPRYPNELSNEVDAALQRIATNCNNLFPTKGLENDNEIIDYMDRKILDLIKLIKSSPDKINLI